MTNYLNTNIGDWGLGIGDWGLAQSPIPNPQSPIRFYKTINPFQINLKLVVSRYLIDIINKNSNFIYFKISIN